jgi:hypothetical protein
MRTTGWCVYECWRDLQLRLHLLHLSSIMSGRVAITGRGYGFVIPHSLIHRHPSTLAASTPPAGPQAAMLAIVWLLDDRSASYCSQCKLCAVLDPCCADKSEQCRSSHQGRHRERGSFCLTCAWLASWLRAWPRLGSPKKDCSFHCIPKHSKASGECTGAWITVS